MPIALPWASSQTLCLLFSSYPCLGTFFPQCFHLSSFQRPVKNISHRTDPWQNLLNNPFTGNEHYSFQNTKLFENPSNIFQHQLHQLNSNSGQDSKLTLRPGKEIWSESRYRNQTSFSQALHNVHIFGRKLDYKTKQRGCKK